MIDTVEGPPLQKAESNIVPESKNQSLIDRFHGWLAERRQQKNEPQITTQSVEPLTGEGRSELVQELLLDLKEPEGLDTSVMERISEGIMSLTGSEKSTTVDRIKGKLSDVVSTRVEQVSAPVQDGEGNEAVFILQQEQT